jgi:hypothetical protein
VVLEIGFTIKTYQERKYFEKNYPFFHQLSAKKFGNITSISVQNFDINSLKNRELAFYNQNQ